MQPNKTEDNCHCGECRVIHEEFIEQFGRWPNMTHGDGQELKARRESNERSWEEAIGEHIAEDEATEEFGEALAAQFKQQVEDAAVHHKERMSGEQHE